MFPLLGPLEPVIIWTRAQEKEWKRGGAGSLVPGVQSPCTGEESDVSAPNSVHAQAIKKDPHLSSDLCQLRRFLAQLLIWGHRPQCSVNEKKPGRVVGDVLSLYQSEGLKIAYIFREGVLKSPSPSLAAEIKCAVCPGAI